ncbi:MAG: transglutaminase family protein [Betaproteobacteria bacterium]|nr:transglutaminase family protein [Betaproteobacteria bacterium]
MSTAPEYLSSASHIDSDDPGVQKFAREHAKGATDVEKAVSLYYAVRDLVRYNPFIDYSGSSAFRASEVLALGEGFCVGKASLLAACARAVGIPARIGLADVKNHLTTPRLREKMGTDLFVYHGFTELLLEGRWVKATPAFNQALCEKFRVTPLEFDGREDSVFHEFDADNRRHMEYIRDHGSFADVPEERIRTAFREVYPGLFEEKESLAKESFG